MQRCLLSICVAMSLVGQASAVEFTHMPTPQLADIQSVRLFVHTSPAGSCDLSRTEVIAVAERVLDEAGMASIDGLDPSWPTSPILEIEIDALELLRSCYLTMKIILRIGATEGAAQGDHQHEMAWGDAGNYVCLPKDFIDRVSELLQSRLLRMIADIERARMTFPDL